MFTSKRFSIAVSFLAAGLLGMHVSNTPNVSAQIKPAMVRNVDEPARVPYIVSAAPNCPFVNDCSISGPIVPVGKRVRITRLQGVLINQQAGNTFFSLGVNDTRHPLVIFPAAQFNAAFWGLTVSFSQEVDYYYEAGQTPVLEVGTAPNSISNDNRTNLTLVGYMVDVQP